MAKSDRLLQTVLDRPHDLSALAVYGDALQANGDARGALIAVQRQRLLATTERRRRALKLQEQQLLREHPDLLGPLAGLAGLEVTWRLGFVRSLELKLDRGGREALVAALAQPAFAALEHLHLRLGRLDPSPVIEALPQSVQHLGLDPDYGGWQDLDPALLTVPSLDLSGWRELDFEEVRWPRLRRLKLGMAFSRLTAEVVPELELLTVTELPAELAELLASEGSDTALSHPPTALRLVRVHGRPGGWEGAALADGAWSLVHESSADETADAYALPRFAFGVSRVGWGVALERAFFLSTATAPQVDDALAQLGLYEHTYLLKSTAVPVGAHTLTAIELRHRAPSTKLLTELGGALAARGRTFEVSTSFSNSDVLLREYRGEKAEPLAMGPFRDRERVFRAGVDHALGFDPGPCLDALHEALDAEPPRGGHAWPVETPTREWPCVTALPPTQERAELDEDVDPDFGDDPAAPIDWWSEPTDAPEEAWVDRPPAVPREEVQVSEADGLEPAVDDGPDEPYEPEPSSDARRDAQWEQIITETPVELEDEGGHPNPEVGHDEELKPFEPDAVAAEETGRCARCDLPTDDGALYRCPICGREVCARCTLIDRDPPVCRACLG
ncbi:MAG: hypothetical protein IPJ65_06910 [Archangiaceae bacterium]|nr:hypothetical protein [Archangiaceae bacterium]